MISLSPYPGDPRPRRAAETLLNEGMTVDFICIADGKFPRREKANGLDVRRLAIEHRRGGKLAYAYEYASFILATASILAWRSLKKRYDLVYVHNMPDVLVVSALFPKLLGAKVVLDQHDPMPELMTTIFNLDASSFVVRFMTWLEKWSIARVHHLITVNVACKRIFCGRSCPAEKISVVMNAPDDKIFQFRAAEPMSGGDATRKPFVLMYHGSLVERNGLDLAVEALAQVREQIPSAQLKIYGRKTPFLDKVMGEIRTKQLEDCVQYLGPKKLEELVAEIAACDVGVIPNQRSAFSEINTPTRIFEYLALGKPVIAPRAGGICDYFHEDSLVFFELGNAGDLAERIQYVYTHPAEVFEIARRGQEIYRDHNWPTERKRLTDVVSGLVGARAKATDRA